ncbi:hypothetical protein HPB49_020991 [Dermacentor silvarum]|uniref:Uncharacterized protein n=1 Tax=Dermacentor silvarum TaxID=543639 RepID=A0ACB8CMV5_DERSI|nr:hypothetical protein HPB49_020991 [Dermacentor silvarum]
MGRSVRRHARQHQHVKTFKILKHLLDPSGNKTAVKAKMTKIRHKYKGNIREMRDEIVPLYIERPPAVEHRNYSGSPNEDLNRDFSQQEIRVVLQTIKIKRAPATEKAQQAAQELTYRGSDSDGPTPRTDDEVAIQDNRDRLGTYQDILTHYKKQSEAYLTQHKQLDRSQETDWRRLQTRTFQNPVDLKKVNSRQYPEASCKLCKHEHADMAHILWKCTEIRTIYREDHIESALLEKRWLSALTSSDLHDQLWASQQALEVVERLRLTAHNVPVARALAGNLA